MTTFAGAFASVYLAKTLLMAFTGAGLVPAAVATDDGFAAAVALGAGITVGLAAWRGLPISTTRVVVGALTGAGMAGRGVNRNVLGGIAFAWLVTLPVGAAFVALIYGLLHGCREPRPARACAT